MQPMGAVVNAHGEHGARAGSSNAISEKRLIGAAHEFEGQMLKELLKPLASGGMGSDGDDSGGILGEFAAEALGRGLSERGGLGIARQIVDRLSGGGNASVAAAVTGDGHFDTGLSRLK